MTESKLTKKKAPPVEIITLFIGLFFLLLTLVTGITYAGFQIAHIWEIMNSETMKKIEETTILVTSIFGTTGGVITFGSMIIIVNPEQENSDRPY